MKAWAHQEKIALLALEKLRKYALVYLAMEERTGKSLSAILACEHSPYLNRILIITNKKPIKGWNDTISSYKPKKYYYVINYEALHKLESQDWDLIILDEAHNLAKFPVPGKRQKAVRALTKGKPIIYLSATPNAQSYSQLYHQLQLSDWSPWRMYNSFYAWFKDYGIPRTRFVGGKQFKEYTNTKESWIIKDIAKCFISYTRQELGFEFEPYDVPHYIQLEKRTKDLYNQLEKTQVYETEDFLATADTPMALMTKLHQVEGGTLKQDDKSILLGNTEKIDYIKQKWGDSENTVIFYHYKAEEMLLRSHFKKARLAQSVSEAEGVDFSMYEHLIVYSMNFSTAKYTQRRARQANMNRDTEINVHFLLTKGGISEQVYTTVAVNKKNYVDKYYTKGALQ